MLRISRRFAWRTKTASAALGACVFIAMGASTFAFAGDDAAAYTEGMGHYPLATYTVKKAPRELSTPSASPTFKATVCDKRETLPC